MQSVGTVRKTRDHCGNLTGFKYDPLIHSLLYRTMYNDRNIRHVDPVTVVGSSSGQSDLSSFKFFMTCQILLTDLNGSCDRSCFQGIGYNDFLLFLISLKGNLSLIRSNGFTNLIRNFSEHIFFNDGFQLRRNFFDRINTILYDRITSKDDRNRCFAIYIGQVDHTLISLGRYGICRDKGCFSIIVSRSRI